MTGKAKAKLITLLVLVALMLIFVFQNLGVVEIRFLFWSALMSRSLLVLIFFLLGAAAGWIGANLARKHRI